MKRRKLIEISIFVLLCAGLWFYRYFSFNSEIAKTYTAKRTYFAVNDSVEYGDNIINLHTYKGCSMKLKKATLLDMENFCRQFDLLGAYGIMQEENDATADSKICLLELEFTNGSNYSQAFDLGDLVLCGLDKTLNQSVFVTDINPELNLDEKSTIHTEPKFSQTVLIPFLLNRDGFSSSQWEQLENYPLYLFVTQFPEERVICVDYI